MELLKLNWEEKTSAEYFKIKKLKSSIEKLNEIISDNILFCYVDNVYLKKFLAQEEDRLLERPYSVSTVAHCRDYGGNQVSSFNHYKDRILTTGSYLYGLFDSSIKNVVHKDIFPVIYCRDNFIKKTIDNTSSDTWTKDSRMLFQKYNSKGF